MRIIHQTCAVLAAACLAIGSYSTDARAQIWPQRNVHVVVAFAPAGPVDIIARLLGQALQAKWGHAVIIENRAGAGGNTGAVAVARAEPDGYTILAHSSAYAVNLTLFEKPGYALSDFQTAAVATTAPNFIVGAPDFRPKTLNDIIAAAKTENLAYASPGVGTTPQLMAELIFRQLAKVDVRHVPFTGAGPAANAVMAGHVPMGFLALPGVIEQIKARTVNAIAISSDKRLAEFPDVPTVNEAGLGPIEAGSVVAFFMPARTPAAIVAKFNADVNDIIRSGALDKAFAAAGSTPLTWTPAQSQDFIAAETRKWGEVVKAAGLKVE